MRLFIDTDVLVSAVTMGPHSASCRALLIAIALGSVSATTSTLVIEELWRLEAGAEGGSGPPPGTAADAFEIFPEVVPLDEWVLQTAFTIEPPVPVGPGPRLHAATCRAHRLDAIVSTDTSYEAFGWLRRIEPDAEGLAEFIGRGASSAAG